MLQQYADTRTRAESTNARVWIMSSLSIVVLIASGLWQIFYLKRFFTHQKLL